MEITDEVRKSLMEKGIYTSSLPAPKPIKKGTKK